MKKLTLIVRADIEQALESLAGVTFHDNAALWQEWWAGSEATLRAAIEGFRSLIR